MAIPIALIHVLFQEMSCPGQSAEAEQLLVLANDVASTRSEILTGCC